jgi:hypothetical protein
MVKIRSINQNGALGVAFPKEVETHFNLQKGDEIGFFKEIPETLDKETMMVLQFKKEAKIIF